MQQITVLLMAWYTVMSVIAFILYGFDKRLAKQRKRRIPEKTLLGFGFFGGAVGALLGMEVFRHKTKHWHFWFLNILGLCWQAAVLVLAAANRSQ